MLLSILLNPRRLARPRFWLVLGATSLVGGVSAVVTAHPTRPIPEAGNVSSALLSGPLATGDVVLDSHPAQRYRVDVSAFHPDLPALERGEPVTLYSDDGGSDVVAISIPHASAPADFYTTAAYDDFNSPVAGRRIGGLGSAAFGVLVLLGLVYLAYGKRLGLPGMTPRTAAQAHAAAAQVAANTELVHAFMRHLNSFSEAAWVAVVSNSARIGQQCRAEPSGQLARSIVHTEAACQAAVRQSGRQRDWGAAVRAAQAAVRASGLPAAHAAGAAAVNAAASLTVIDLVGEAQVGVLWMPFEGVLGLPTILEEAGRPAAYAAGAALSPG